MTFFFRGPPRDEPAEEADEASEEEEDAAELDLAPSGLPLPRLFTPALLVFWLLLKPRLEGASGLFQPRDSAWLETPLDEDPDPEADHFRTGSLKKERGK